MSERHCIALTAEGLREMGYDFDFEGAKVLVNF